MLLATITYSCVKLNTIVKMSESNSSSEGWLGCCQLKSNIFLYNRVTTNTTMYLRKTILVSTPSRKIILFYQPFLDSDPEPEPEAEGGIASSFAMDVYTIKCMLN